MTYIKLNKDHKRIIENNIKNETVANQKLIRERASAFELFMLIYPIKNQNLQQIITRTIDRIKKRIEKAKSKYKPSSESLPKSPKQTKIDDFFKVKAK